jgi:FtsP/CotA-like multicopper oxidase with cupredoxin domain
MRRKEGVPVAHLTVLAVVLISTAGPWGAAQGAAKAVPSHDQQAVRQRIAHRVSNADRRRAAAARAAWVAGQAGGGVAPRVLAAPTPGGQPDYFGPYPNFANSPLPRLDAQGNVIPGTGIRKFVDGLPGLGAGTANNLGQYIPVANPDTISYPRSDYYVIALVEYTEKMHSDLPPTTLRGYVQLNNGTDPQTRHNTIVPAPVHYMGPLIIAQRNRPVRIQFRNMLPTGAGGNLFIPVDTTYMGAGMGPRGRVPGADPFFKQNRATVHLHGGVTPWISDGTPHQWTTPAGEQTLYPRGVSVRYVPDMDGGVEPPGWLSFYYTNQQSARLMFIHDHAYGITRLNVYAGEAAAYLVQDPVEQALVAAGTIPADQIPLVIQDRTFVPDNATPYTSLVGTFASQLAAQDPTWDTKRYGGYGQLWFPHVYMPNQNPYDIAGVNAMGRWDYGPWTWPPFSGIQHGPRPNPYYDPANAPWEPPEIPGVPSTSGVPEAFMDTPIVNGTAYPVLHVKPKAYRFRILNVCNDRALNLQLYYAKSNATMWNQNGVLRDGDAGEVHMVPAVPNRGLPATWPTDGRAGGVPDPHAAGPDWYQIGSEGGLLPAVAVIPPTPVGYEYDRRVITVLNVTNRSLMLGPAERADVIVDFSKVPPGSKLIVYNDAPAPNPGFDTRLDYYTGDPDQTVQGGAPTTQPGYGPNTRTIMQIQVDAGVPHAFSLARLQAALPVAFSQSQDTIIVPQTAYDPVYGTTTPNDASQYVAIQDTSHTFTPIGQAAPVTVGLVRKAIQEDFSVDYGRMIATLGVELPMTNFQVQTTIMLGYIDPATEVVTLSDKATPIGAAGDGTQIWKFTHNGVDTHSVHFHLFNVQLVNRVGWDGSMRPPLPQELGWKETLLMNPLEDCIVALRPLRPKLPWPLPNSVRPLDVTAPIGSTVGFADVNPTNNHPVTVTNEWTNFGWEYVMHCHLLGHEEYDMMRPMSVAVAPSAPIGLAAALNKSGISLSWTDTSINATGFVVQRARDSAFIVDLVTFPRVKAPSMTDTTVAMSRGLSYYYRVFAINAVGSGFAGYAKATMWSASSNTVTVGPPAGTVKLVSLTQAAPPGSPVVAAWTYAPAGDQTGFQVQRATDSGFTTGLTSTTVNASATTYTDTSVTVGTTYFYRARATSVLGKSAWSNVRSVTVH